MIEKEIKKKNKIPGSCEEFTRADEIGELNKYLATKKKVLDDSLELGQKGPVLPTKDLGSLQDHRETLNVRGNVELTDKIESLDVGEEISLGDTIDLLTSGEKINNLVDKVERIEGGSHVGSLETNKEVLSTEGKVNSLANKVVSLESSNKEVILEDEVLNIKKLTTPGLSAKTVLLEEIEKIGELSKNKEALEANSIKDLSDKKINLRTDKEPAALENNKKKLEGLNKDIELGDEILVLGEKKSLINLQEHREQLGPRKSIQSLEETKVDLNKEEKVTDLSQYKEIIDSKLTCTLPDKKETIQTKGNLKKLPTERVDIRDKEEVANLSDGIERLFSITRSTDLQQQKDLLLGKRDLESLSNTRDELKGTRKSSELEDYRDTLTDQRSTTLEADKEEIIDSRKIKLRELTEKLTRKQNTELDNHREKLTKPKADITLGTKVINGPEESIIEALEENKENLSGAKDKNKEVIIKQEVDIVLSGGKRIDSLSDLIISGPKEEAIPELEDHKETIGSRDINSLSSIKKNLGGVEEIDSLSSTLIGELKEEVPELENTKLSISHGQIESLEDLIITGPEEEEIGLEDHKEEITVSQTSSLEDTIITGESNKIDSLHKGFIRTEGVEEVDNLSDFLENLIGIDKEINLPTQKQKIENSKTIESLPESIVEGPKVEEQKSLEDEKVLRPGNKIDVELEGDKLLRPEDVSPSTQLGIEERKEWSKEDGLYEEVLTIDKEEEVEDLEEEKLVITENRIESLGEKFILAPTTDSDSEIEKVTEILEKLPQSTEKLKLELYKLSLLRDKDLNLYYTSIIKFAENLSRFADTGYGYKIAGLISTYLSKKSPTKSDVESFEKALYAAIAPSLMETGEEGWQKKSIPPSTTARVNSLMQSFEFTPHHKLTGSLVKNHNEFLRFLAENSVGFIKGGNGKDNLLGRFKSKGRQLLLDEALGMLILGRDKLERATKANRDRLPGADDNILAGLVRGGLKGAVTSGINKLAGSLFRELDYSNPQNRPNPKEPTSKWTPLNTKSINLNSGTEDGGYSFKDNYCKGEGIKTTITDLCAPRTKTLRLNSGDEESSVIIPSNVEGLMELIRTSPYMNSVDKYTSSSYSNKVMTLDSNYYWEIIFMPFVGELNGNFSYLPSIEEINLINEKVHGIRTGYYNWIPINSFELSKSKMTTKSLQLFDGEFSYPTSIEFTNELRLTIVDDQFKSFRNYFEKCFEVSVYNSAPHDSEWYEKDGAKEITKVDHNYNLVAPYKNITFRCVIYVMTPQKSTINKYDLLVLLKDFAKERSGDSSPSDTELNVSFSIVGENPSNAELPKQEYTPPTKVNPKNDSPSKASVLGNALNTGMSCI